MTAVLHQYPQHQYLPSVASSSSSSSYHHQHQLDMQNPPFRPRMGHPPRSPPIPPSLLDSPFVQSPNSPFRRDHSVSPNAPGASTRHDRLNILDTIPITGPYSGPSPVGLEPEPTPDDIGLAGTPKTARSSSINNRSAPNMPSHLRPGLARGNSWTLQQQQGGGAGQRPPSSATSSVPAAQRVPSTTPHSIPRSSTAPSTTSPSSATRSSAAPPFSAARS